MTDKLYVIEEIGNMFRVLKGKEPLTTKFESHDKQDVENLVDELNALHEEVETGKEYCKVLETDLGNCADRRIQLQKENEQLKEENNMLKITIARNEAYIERITHKGEWKNTSNEIE